MKKLTVIIEKGDSDNYGAHVPKLPGCISEGDTLEEVKANIKEAIIEHLEALADFNEVPEELDINNLKFQFKLDLPSFSKAFTWINVSALADEAGINPSLVRQYTSGKKYPSEKQAGLIQQAINRLSEDLGRVQLI
ncbi:MAG: type II toxin-antitoxin system HicB family antitoxin [Bacteroidales bacterium]|nr:type II toxin-antitoxin system HicB family antitoxin [Bacteroidales bacterium]